MPHSWPSYCDAPCGAEDSRLVPTGGRGGAQALPRLPHLRERETMETEQMECRAFYMGSGCPCPRCEIDRRTCLHCECVRDDIEERTDARGIYITKCCEKCWREVRKGYRSDVLNDPGYECDEPIEPEEY